MAKAKDLAALAGLAGLGYMLSKKGDKAGADTGVDSNPTRAARPDSTETRKEPRRQITDYIKKAPLDDTDKYPSGVMGGARMADDVRPTPVKPSNVVPGNDLPPATPLKSFTRDYKDPEKQKVYDTLNEKSGANTSSAQRSDQLQDLSRAVKREAKTKQFAQDVPYQESSAKTDAMAVASRAARAADAKRRAAKQSAYKSGGTVSSVSKRADGIATKGKTRGKIC